LTVGKKIADGGTGSFTVSQTTASINGLIDALPGGGKSTKLTGDVNASAIPDSWLKNGNIDNTLLAQTLTLGLNLGIQDNLASFVLESGKWLVTQKKQSCDFNSTAVVPCAYDSVMFDASVVTFLYNNKWDAATGTFVADNGTKTATVAELYLLANALLGGATYSGVNLSAVASVEDAINNIFDECRFSLGYFAGYPSQPTPKCVVALTTLRASRDLNSSEIVNNLSVAAYPNPFNDRVRFTIKSVAAGQGSLEVFNTLGQKVKTIYQGYLNAGSEQVVEYRVPAAHRQNLIYVLTLNGKRVTGKLLNAKE